jgi:ribulose 1,5-bisphosphate carboxylase large subunit-like protein
VAGLAPGYALGDPLLAVASEGDGVVRLPRVLQALPGDVVMQAGSWMIVGWVDEFG